MSVFVCMCVCAQRGPIWDSAQWIVTAFLAGGLGVPPYYHLIHSWRTTPQDVNNTFLMVCSVMWPQLMQEKHTDMLYRQTKKKILIVLHAGFLLFIFNRFINLCPFIFILVKLKCNLKYTKKLFKHKSCLTKGGWWPHLELLKYKKWNIKIGPLVCHQSPLQRQAFLHELCMK